MPVVAGLKEEPIGGDGCCTVSGCSVQPHSVKKTSAIIPVRPCMDDVYYTLEGDGKMEVRFLR